MIVNHSHKSLYIYYLFNLIFLNSINNSFRKYLNFFYLNKGRYAQTRDSRDPSAVQNFSAVQNSRTGFFQFFLHYIYQWFNINTNIYTTTAHK